MFYMDELMKRKQFGHAPNGNGVSFYLDNVGGVADLLGSGSGGVGRCVGVCGFGGAGCGVIVTGVAVTDGDD